MRPADPYAAVGESLQADVMRFMAIIAFCLIAILALVRSVEPTATSTSVAKLDPAAPAGAGAAPVREVETHPRLRAAVEPEAAITQLPPRPVSPRAVPPDAVPPLPSPPVAPQPLQQPTHNADQGLSLRFASDQDFLRLVTRGDIRVYAFKADDVLSLAADFQFVSAPPPGQVHELLADTIPPLMAAALHRARSQGGYRWGVRMPERMELQIRKYVHQGVTGELVIDRFGEVRHRAGDADDAAA